VTCRQTTTSFLLYLRDTPAGKKTNSQKSVSENTQYTSGTMELIFEVFSIGGTTDFLDAVADGNVIRSVAPRRGSILVLLFLTWYFFLIQRSHSLARPSPCLGTNF
jgi:hypothetical protein